MSTRKGKNLRKRKHITGLIDAIRAYYDSTEGEPGKEPADILARDCITDLMHAADVFEFDFEAALTTARNHYGEEHHHGKRERPAKSAPTGKGTYRVYSRMKSVQSCDVEATSPEDASAQVEKLEESGDPWGKEFLEDSERDVVKLKRVRRYNAHTKRYSYSLEDPRD